jgi:hypothetical protein
MGENDAKITKKRSNPPPNPAKPERRKKLRKETKRLGELAEANFLSKATSMGFHVSKPWGDSERYDFIVDVKGRIFRVQVKSAHVEAKCGGGYHIDCGRTRYRDAYTLDEIDMLVAYICPEDAWYIFPPSAFLTMGGVYLCTRGMKTSKYHRYREAWEAFYENK